MSSSPLRTAPWVLLGCAVFLLACGRAKVGGAADTGVDPVASSDAQMDMTNGLDAHDTPDAVGVIDADQDAGSDVALDLRASVDMNEDSALGSSDSGRDTRADGGTDALFPMCESGSFPGQPGCALGADLTLVATSVSAKVTVVSVEDVATDACRGLSLTGDGGPAKRLVLTADAQQQWTTYIRIPGLPADLVRAGDQLDLDISARPATLAGIPLGVSQTVVLARNGQMVLFTSSLSYFGVPQVPMLDAYGIVVKNDGVICEDSPAPSCPQLGYRALVTVGTQSTTVVPNQTVQIGNLSFTVSAFLESGDNGTCDGLSPTRMAGFMTNP